MIPIRGLRPPVQVRPPEPHGRLVFQARGSVHYRPIRSRWTPDMDEELRRMWEAGVACQLIADKIGLSRNACIGRAHRLGFRRRPNPVHEAEMRRQSNGGAG